ncbi:MAG: TspO/MBR family protein [Bacteroidales bacterium]
MIIRIVIFLIINFAALGIGGLFTSEGVPSDWYQNLVKAPWTPPGWVFGSAWTLIMIFFAVYMAYGWKQVDNKSMFLTLFIFQWIFNVLWNPVFFKFHLVFAGLIIISILAVLVGIFIIAYFKHFKFYSLLIFPYFIWLMIATSLNLYIFI